MQRFLVAAVAVATVAYPLIVYLALHRFEARWVALVLVALAIGRAVATRQAFWVVAAAGATVLGTISALGNAWLPLKLYPVLVNAVLLAVFGASLARPPSMIERLARLSEPQLPPAAVAYTRVVTQVWCGFFALNGMVALGTALWASTETWTLYNGLIAYLLMGLLFGGEMLVRQRVKARLAGASHG